MTLEFRSVTKRVGADTHIYDTTLALAPTGFNVLLGPTGAGKSTLIRLMAGLEQPTTGEIWFKGENVTGQSTQKRRLSLVHQFFVNYPNLTVYENIASPLRVSRLPRAEIQRRVGEAAALMRLEPFLKRRPSELSGGQQQRTALARAIVKDSELVLLDEPLANLDYKLREELRDQLPDLFAGRGAIVVYATSDPKEALLLGGHTATLHEGRVTQFAETGNAYRQPVDLTSAAVFSDPPINIAPVVKAGDRIILRDGVDWAVPAALGGIADGRYKVGIRPHFVSPQPVDSATGTVVEIDGRVLITELSGSESVAHFEMGDGVWVAQSHGVHPYRVGEAHRFHVDVSGCLYFDSEERLVAA